MIIASAGNSAAQTDDETSLQFEMEQLKKRIAELEAALGAKTSELEKALESAKSLKVEMEKLRSENDRLRNKLVSDGASRLSNEAKSASAAQAECEKKVTQLEKLLAEREAEIERLEQLNQSNHDDSTQVGCCPIL